MDSEVPAGIPALSECSLYTGRHTHSHGVCGAREETCVSSSLRATCVGFNKWKEPRGEMAKACEMQTSGEE